MLSIICQKLWARIWVGILPPPFNNFLREDVCGFQVLSYTSFSKASPTAAEMHFPLFCHFFCVWLYIPKPLL